MNPECECCGENAEEDLYDNYPGMDRVIVCLECKEKILAVQLQTNQPWYVCIVALSNPKSINVDDAVKWIMNKKAK